MNEILINKTAQIFRVTKIEAMQIIEQYMLNNNIDELLILTNLKGVLC